MKFAKLILTLTWLNTETKAVDNLAHHEQAAAYYGLLALGEGGCMLAERPLHDSNIASVLSVLTVLRPS